MIRRWLGPVVVGALFGAAAWQATMVVMPDALMRLAVQRVSKVGGPTVSPRAARHRRVARDRPAGPGPRLFLLSVRSFERTATD